METGKKRRKGRLVYNRVMMNSYKEKESKEDQRRRNLLIMKFVRRKSRKKMEQTRMKSKNY